MKLIVLYGPPAVGKYTVGKELGTLTGFKLFHNHMTINLLEKIFEYGDEAFLNLNGEIRLKIIEEAAKKKINLIFTFVFGGEADEVFVQKLIEIVKIHNGQIYFVRLYCSESELMKRVTREDRKELHKISTEKFLKQKLKELDLLSVVKSAESFSIDSTNLTFSETAKKIAEWIPGLDQNDKINNE